MKKYLAILVAAMFLIGMISLTGVALADEKDEAAAEPDTGIVLTIGADDEALDPDYDPDYDDMVYDGVYDDEDWDGVDLAPDGYGEDDDFWYEEELDGAVPEAASDYAVIDKGTALEGNDVLRNEDALTTGAKLGDIDGDGEIKAMDARAALRAAVKLDTLTDAEFAAADVDKDGEVTALDARMILRAAVGLEDLDAAEEPENPDQPEEPSEPASPEEPSAPDEEASEAATPDEEASEAANEDASDAANPDEEAAEDASYEDGSEAANPED